MDVERDSGEGWERREKSCRERPRECLQCLEQSAARRADAEGASGEVSEIRDMLLDIGGKKTLGTKW